MKSSLLAVTLILCCSWTTVLGFIPGLPNFEVIDGGIVGECPSDSYWTPWHNRDGPSGKGDYENRNLYEPKGNCASDPNLAPPAIEVRLAATGETFRASRDYVEVSPGLGLICKNDDQWGKDCDDYKVRYCCKKEGKKCPTLTCGDMTGGSEHRQRDVASVEECMQICQEFKMRMIISRSIKVSINGITVSKDEGNGMKCYCEEGGNNQVGTCAGPWKSCFL